MLLGEAVDNDRALGGAVVTMRLLVGYAQLFQVLNQGLVTTWCRRETRILSAHQASRRSLSKQRMLFSGPENERWHGLRNRIKGFARIKAAAACGTRVSVSCGVVTCAVLH